MKKRILSLITSLTLVASLVTAVPALAAAPYKALDLSLTQTSFDAIGQTGQIKAHTIAEETVTMPVLTINGVSSAVELNADGSYKTTEGTAQNLPRRKAITEGTLTYSTDDDSVITLNSDGSFTTVGYGVANVKVVYDKNTPDNTADDVSSNVMITVSDKSKLEVYPSSYSATSGITLLTKKDGVTAAGVMGRSAMYAKFPLAWDPMGGEKDPLVLTSLVNNGHEGEATTAVEPGETAVFSGWFYDNLTVTGSGDFISFGYAGNTGNTKVINDGNKSITIGPDYSTNSYRIKGGIYSSSWAHPNYDYGKLNTSGAATAAGATAGVCNVGTRTVGWHQFVVTAETSIVNPGTDYMLVKAYLDGELITAQDIYVGNVPVENRRFNLVCHGRITAAMSPYYKDLTVKTFKRTGTIVETIPSDGAANVPLRQMIKVKLASASTSVPAVSVTANGNTVSSSATLDSTGTIVTIDAGKLTAGALYNVTVADESFAFTAGSDSEMATMLDSMTDYKIADTRYVDFADTDKTAEEYGVGYTLNRPGTESSVNGTYLTMTEKKRNAETYAGQNGIVLRNISPRNGDTDRVVVSYKFRPNTVATDPTTSSLGIGIPYMAKDDTTDTYNNMKTAMMSGAKANVLPTGVGINNKGYSSVAHFLLQGNIDGSASAYAEDGTAVSNGYVYIPTSSAQEATYYVLPDSDGWYRLTYVVDVDKNGFNAPTWTTIFGDDLDNQKYMFKLYTTPVDATAYTSVDSIFIPTTKNAAVANDIVTDIKDIEVYNLVKTVDVTIDEQPVVTEAGTETEVLAGNLAGKTVDVSINAQGNGESYVVIVAAKDSDNQLLNVKTASGTLGANANIGIDGFEIPSVEGGKTATLYVFVWDSLERAVPIFEKIEYKKAQ